MVYSGLPPLGLPAVLQLVLLFKKAPTREFVEPAHGGHVKAYRFDPRNADRRGMRKTWMDLIHRV